MESKTFRIREAMSPLAPDDYKRHTWEHLKHEVGIKLYSILEQEKNPAVVEINERIINAPKGKEDWIVYEIAGDILEIEVIITPVQYRYVEMLKSPPICWNDGTSRLNLYQRMKRKFSWLKLP